MPLYTTIVPFICGESKGLGILKFLHFDKNKTYTKGYIKIPIANIDALYY